MKRSQRSNNINGINSSRCLFVLSPSKNATACTARQQTSAVCVLMRSEEFSSVIFVLSDNSKPAATERNREFAYVPFLVAHSFIVSIFVQSAAAYKVSRCRCNDLHRCGQLPYRRKGKHWCWLYCNESRKVYLVVEFHNKDSKCHLLRWCHQH